MTARPSEIRDIAALLEQGAESPEALAKAVINRVDELREDRVGHVVVCAAPGPAIWVYGPYPTAEAAAKAAWNGKVPMAGIFQSAIGTLHSAAYAARSTGV